MSRRARSIEGGLIYHVLNRPNARAELFRMEADYLEFERILDDAFRRVPLRNLG
jgi:REP element-mobilizing transposase RayT